MHTGLRFFSRGSHGRGNQGRGNWNKGPRRPRFSIHVDADSQELGQLFQARFFNWIGQGVVQPRPERPPFQVPQTRGIRVPPHVSLQTKVPETIDGKRLSNQKYPNIVARPICPYLLPRLLTRFPKMHLSTRQFSPLMLAKG